MKSEKLRELFYTVKDKEKAFEKVVYSHVRRTHSLLQRADKLVNEALDNN